MSDPHIRPLGLEDLPILMTYEGELFGSDRWSEALYRSDIVRRDRQWWAIETPDGRFAGWAGVMVGPQADLLTIGIVPAYQGRGWGRALLQWCLENAREAGSREIFLEVRVTNKEALNLYQSIGFAEIGIRRRYYRDGIDAAVMQLRLAEPSPGPLGSC
ncbi:MAG: ribosomal protein S18-alanine N-acetyltransferase [Bowdeniella nasicola]|nr:ribosomal protein S18-alanine N-acetyltransferase [Bowdeniella nasicola]